ncbi:MAG: VWA domain-containing protein [Neisseriaceae bacterium]|nr:VWA domain-containing protein [Neisseriaceae bacterium]
MRYLSLLSIALLAACTTSPQKQVNQPTPTDGYVTQEVASRPTDSGGVTLYGAIKGGLADGNRAMLRSMVVPHGEYQPPLITDREQYAELPDSPVHLVAENPISTFSIDVDTGSYSNIRRFLNKNRLPPRDAVRIEELVNYFDYDYPKSDNGTPFSISSEVFDSPFKTDAKIMKIALRADDRKTNALPPANLVFLVDVSGSMTSDDKLPLVKQTLHILTEQLRSQDKVSIITYASGEKLVLPATSGSNKKEILQAVDSLKAGGATAGEQAIQMAYREAEKAYIKDGINRIILATDGDFNVGITDRKALTTMVSEKRKSGISLSALGFGTGNYNEAMMEQIADAGNGNFFYIDSRREAKKVVGRELSATLMTVAQDVKIQVEFNPATVREYRLIGYENRQLKREDFNNDAVDAGDMGAGNKVTAFYEFVPVGKKGWIDDSRYATTPVAKGKDNEYAFVKLRYKLPKQTQSKLLQQPVNAGSKPFHQASSDSRFAMAVVAYGEALRGCEYNGKMSWDDILALAKNNQKPDPYGDRAEFVDLIEMAKSLSTRENQ